MAQTRVSLRQIENGEKLSKIISWFEQTVEKDTFPKRVDDFFTQMRRSAQKAGYGPKDVERIIRKVRQQAH